MYLVNYNRAISIPDVIAGHPVTQTLYVCSLLLTTFKPRFLGITRKKRYNSEIIQAAYRRIVQVLAIGRRTRYNFVSYSYIYNYDLFLKKGRRGEGGICKNNFAYVIVSKKATTEKEYTHI